MNRSSPRQKLYALLRVFSSGAHNLFRNAWLTTAAIAVMIVTLTIVFFGGIAYKTLDDTITDYSRNLTVSIYLQDREEGQYQPLREALESNPVVDQVNYVSKAEAVRRFQTTFANDRQLLEGLGLSEGNALPASLDVVINDVAKFQEVLDLANDPAYSDVVDEARFNDLKQGAFNSFVNLRRFFVRASVIGGIIFGSISVLIIFNTIRMAIFTRSQEIEIMKLIGATPSYIRGPFLVEALLYGLIASIISLAIIYSTIFAVEPRLGGDINADQVMQLVTDRWYMTFAAIIGTGLLIGLGSSAFATSRYLRLKKW